LADKNPAMDEHVACQLTRTKLKEKTVVLLGCAQFHFLATPLDYKITGRPN
jgi:hypothetical protein